MSCTRFLSVLTLWVVALGCGQQANEGVTPVTSPPPPERQRIEISSDWKPPQVNVGEPIVLKEDQYRRQEYVDRSKELRSGGSTTLRFPRLANGWYVDWDAERKPLDLIVIHHSATGPTVTADSISNSQRERLYVPRYRSESQTPYVKGLPVHSGHVVNGKETFIGYHHLVYPDGRITTELSPLTRVKGVWHVDMVGWHAGNWDANCRSIGICLVGDFTKEEPPEAQVAATLKLIAYYHTLVSKLDVKPHNHFKATECPGRAWNAVRKRL